MNGKSRRVDATLIFDGQCGFCRWSLARIARWLPARPAFVASQSADLGALGLTQQQADTAAWWVDSAGAHGGHLVLARWLRASGFPWSPVGRLLTLAPVSLVAAATYRWIARNRRRLRGPWSRDSAGAGSCGMVS